MQSRPNPLLDFLLVLLRRKRLVLGITLTTVAIVAVYSLVMEKTYTSTALIVPPEGGGGSLMGMLSDLPMGDMLGGLGGMGGDGGGEYFTAILGSRVLRMGLIERFGLREHYELEDTEIEDVFDEMDERFVAELDFESGMIRLSVLDKDPELAREMADWMIARLEELNHDYKTRRARNRREFLGGEVGRVRVELDSLEREMVAFQEDEHLLEPTEQARAILGAYGELKSQEAVKELELRLAKRQRGLKHPDVARLSSELAAIREQLAKSYDSGDSDLFLAVSDLPATTLEFLRRQRELEIAGKKLIFLLPQLEQAKLEEINDTPVLEIIDPPAVAEKRTKPRRTLMVVASGAVALLVASLMALFLERLDGNPALAGQWSDVAGHLRRLLRFKLD